jgi:hypothetical protein
MAEILAAFGQLPIIAARMLCPSTLLQDISELDHVAGTQCIVVEFGHSISQCVSVVARTCGSRRYTKHQKYLTFLSLHYALEFEHEAIGVGTQDMVCISLNMRKAFGPFNIHCW